MALRSGTQVLSTRPAVSSRTRPSLAVRIVRSPLQNVPFTASCAARSLLVCPTVLHAIPHLNARSSVIRPAPQRFPLGVCKGWWCCCCVCCSGAFVVQRTNYMCTSQTSVPVQSVVPPTPPGPVHDVRPACACRVQFNPCLDCNTHARLSKLDWEGGGCAPGPFPVLPPRSA